MSSLSTACSSAQCGGRWWHVPAPSPLPPVLSPALRPGPWGRAPVLPVHPVSPLWLPAEHGSPWPGSAPVGAGSPRTGGARRDAEGPAVAGETHTTSRRLQPTTGRGDTGSGMGRNAPPGTRRWGDGCERIPRAQVSLVGARRETPVVPLGNAVVARWDSRARSGGRAHRDTPSPACPGAAAPPNPKPAGHSQCSASNIPLPGPGGGRALPPPSLPPKHPRTEEEGLPPR